MNTPAGRLHLSTSSRGKAFTGIRHSVGPIYEPASTDGVSACRARDIYER